MKLKNFVTRIAVDDSLCSWIAVFMYLFWLTCSFGHCHFYYTVVENWLPKSWLLWRNFSSLNFLLLASVDLKLGKVPLKVAAQEEKGLCQKSFRLKFRDFHYSWMDVGMIFDFTIFFFFFFFYEKGLLNIDPITQKRKSSKQIANHMTRCAECWEF